jgi:Na+/H+ antiporter NhaD/arsenite permease-like protein
MTSGYAIATLAIFIVSIIFVIRPVSIPTPRRIPQIPINLTTAPILAIALLWAAQCIDPLVFRNGIVGTEGVKPYNIIILFFSLAYMAITLDITGILQAAAFWVSNMGGSNGWKLYFYFYIMLTLLSILLGNDPVILSGTAFLVYYTQIAELSPTAWIMSEFAAANTASMVLFVGNPTNVCLSHRIYSYTYILKLVSRRKVVICEGFGVNNAAFTAYTIFPFLACNLVCFFALGAQYHKKEYVPRKLNRVARLDPRSVLLDPVGAWVGSFMLGSTLILCLVVSFFGIDVWMISLPFAVGKFFFDMAWDHYRYSRGIPMLGLPTIKVVGAEPDEGAMVEALQDMNDNPSYRPTTPPTIHPEKMSSFPSEENTAVDQKSSSPQTDSKTFPSRKRSHLSDLHDRLHKHFPTFFTALPRLPFALVPFAFSQFILIEALSHQGWVDVFATWLVRASHKQMYPTIWLIGVLGVILCNISGTNIGATILLTKVVRAAALPPQTDRAAAIALAVASNIGAVSFTFSASLAGLLWRAILKQKGIIVKQTEFAYWNSLPLLCMTVVGLGVVCAEMAVLYEP